MLMRIDGREITSSTDQWIPVINPATGEQIDRVPRGGPDDVDQAVEVGEKASDTWSGKTPRERGKILFKAAEIVRGDYQRVAELLTLEQGKPIKEAIDEVRGFANILEFFAGISGHLQGDYIPLGPLGDSIVCREPHGVCGAIIPWNVPAIIMGWKVAPALVAGNTMVIKPSSTTPLTNLNLAKILDTAGLPPGVLNVVTGDGKSVGMAIVKHPRIHKISFTGSTATGKAILEKARGQLKEIALELGGSDPMIVWKDANIDKAVSGVIRGRFYNAGQLCNAVKRLFLHEAIADQFIDSLKARVEALRVGNGIDSSVDMGPLHSGEQQEKIEMLVDHVRERGEGTIITGGISLVGEGYNRGFFYAPTLVTDVEPGSPILTEEVFGPVLPIMRFPDLDTAIDGANRSQYGLGASVWTENIGVMKTVFRRVNAGFVWVNRHHTVPPELPFGGIKESGIGRENGFQVLHQYTRTKSLFLGE